MREGVFEIGADDRSGFVVLRPFFITGIGVLFFEVKEDGFSEKSTDAGEGWRLLELKPGSLFDEGGLDANLEFSDELSENICFNINGFWLMRNQPAAAQIRANASAK